MAEKWAGTKQRDDLKTCPFCDTKAVQQVRLSDVSKTQMQFRIGCGNPCCFIYPTSQPFTVLRDAEWAWQERDGRLEIEEMKALDSREHNEMPER
jgi:hypothetical protein